MNMKNLTKISVMGITALVVGVLLLPVVVDAKDAVRPHKVIAEGTIDNLTGEGYETGFGTHIGQYTHVWSAITGSGTVTAANGDTLTWVWDEPGVSASITGGTGRFKNASGSLVFTVSLYDEGDITYYSYTAEGWISY